MRPWTQKSALIQPKTSLGKGLKNVYSKGPRWRPRWRCVLSPPSRPRCAASGQLERLDATRPRLAFFCRTRCLRFRKFGFARALFRAEDVSRCGEVAGPTRMLIIAAAIVSDHSCSSYSSENDDEQRLTAPKMMDS